MTISVVVAIGAILTPIGLGCIYYISKMHTVNMICNHPELSDDKVKSLTKMMTEQHHEDNE